MTATATATAAETQSDVKEQVRKLSKAIGVLAQHREQFIFGRLSNSKGDKHCAVGWLLEAAGEPTGQFAWPNQHQKRVLSEIYGIHYPRSISGANDKVVGLGRKGKEASLIRAGRVVDYLKWLRGTWFIRGN